MKNIDQIKYYEITVGISVYYISFIYSSLLVAQCPTGDIILTTQQEVDKFAEDYPDCNKIEGHIQIGPSTDITNLQGLRNLDSVRFNVEIMENGVLTSLKGLDQLRWVGNHLEVQNNPALTSMTGLGNLNIIGNQLLIDNNDALITLSGLNNLTTIMSTLIVINNAKLKNFSGLENLVTMWSSLSVANNESLENFKGLDNLASDLYDFSVYDNPALKSFAGLEKVNSIENNIYIRSNSSLTTLYGLHNANLASLNLLFLMNNPLLSVCDFPHICSYLVKGASSIAFNADDCDGALEIRTACLPEIESVLAPASIVIECEDQAADIELPANVQVSLDDNTTDIVAVHWDLTEFDGGLGAHSLVGTLDLTDEDITNPKALTANLTVHIGPVTEPSINCHKSKILTCDPVVYFETPTATDVCGQVQMVQTDRTGLTPGSTFPIGITTLTYRATNTAGTSHCSITIEVLSDLEIDHVAGIDQGDTIHIASCVPPRISKDNLDLGPHQNRSKVRTSIFYQELPEDPENGLWKIQNHEYHVTDFCRVENTFRNYVALYDLAPPIFHGIPGDITIVSTSNLPSVPEDVRIIDVCRYVIRDTVVTTPIVHAGTGDTMAFVRRWSAEDEVGNKSFRDQMIYLETYSDTEYAQLTVHLTKVSDLATSHFPKVAGTNNIPVSLYRLDTNQATMTEVESNFSANWQGQNGRLYFTPIHQGLYHMKVDIPEGYALMHTDSLFAQDGWSDTLWVADGASRDLGTLFLIPIQDSTIADTAIQGVEIEESITTSRQNSLESFNIYPNPTTGRLMIKTAGLEGFEYEIYNQIGQLVKDGQGSPIT